MFREDIEDYKSLLGSMKNEAEANYAAACVSGNPAIAYNNLLMMMAYGLVDSNDPRCNEKFDGLGKSVPYGKFRKKDADARTLYGDKTDLGMYDYTTSRGKEYIRKYIYCNLKPRKPFKCTRIGHLVQRVEYSKEGITHSSDTDLNCYFTLVMGMGFVRSVAERVVKLCNRYNIHMNLAELSEAMKIGAIRVYEFGVSNESVPLAIKSLGFVIVRMGGNGDIQAVKIIDYQAFVDNWMNITQFNGLIDDIIKDCVSTDELKIANMVKPDTYEREQSMRIKNDTGPKSK